MRNQKPQRESWGRSAVAELKQNLFDNANDVALDGDERAYHAIVEALASAPSRLRRPIANVQKHNKRLLAG